MNKIYWSKAPEGATHYNHQFCEWYKATQIGAVFYWSESASEWRPARFWNDRKHDCIQRPTAPSWSGEGLPPVGVVCDVKQMARGAEREWFKAKVLFSSPYTVVLDDYQDGEFVSHPCTLQFRPIRTPEQIAADEREAAIDAMLAATPAPGSDISLRVCEQLYDAGYRKP